MNRVENAIVTLCPRLLATCGKPENERFLLNVLYPFVLTSFSLEIAIDESRRAVEDYDKIAIAYPTIRSWIDLLNKVRNSDWFIPVLVPESTEGETGLYLAIFRNTISSEKALLVSSKQDYQSHKLDDILQNMCDKNEAIEYISRFAKGRNMGDTITIGTMTGGILNIKSHLDGASQSIKESTMKEATKSEMEQLIQRLSTELKALPKEQKDDADAIAEVASDLVKKSTLPNPNKKSIQLSANGLLEAAKGIAGVIPIATEIVHLVAKFVGL